MQLRRSQKRESSVSVDSDDRGAKKQTRRQSSAVAAAAIVSDSSPSKKKPRARGTSPLSKSSVIPIVASPSSDANSVDKILFAYDRLVPGRLVRRYKRFLADVEVIDTEHESDDTAPSNDAKVVTVYCPNTGPMVGLLDLPNARVQMSKSDDPKRKYQYTLEMIQVDNGERRVWVGVHSTLANRMVEKAIAAQWLPELGLFSSFQREVRFSSNSRVDFVLSGEGADGVKREKYVEVKSASFAHPIDSSGEDAQECSSGSKRFCALFPDTISERAQKHVTELTELIERRASSAEKAGCAKETSAAIVFVVQRDDCHEFAPSFLHDKEFAALCAQAAKQNIQLLGYSVALEPDEANGRGYARLLQALPLHEHVPSEEACVTEKQPKKSVKKKAKSASKALLRGSSDTLCMEVAGEANDEQGE